MALATVRSAPAGISVGLVAVADAVVTAITRVFVPNGPEVIAPGFPTELTPIRTVPPPALAEPIVVAPVYVFAPFSVMVVSWLAFGLMLTRPALIPES